jgi:hypothetical protein
MGLQDVRYRGMDWIELANDRDRYRALENAVMNLWVLFYWVNFEFVLWMSGKTWNHHTERPLYSITTQSEESFMLWFGTMLGVLQNLCFLTLCTPGKAKHHDRDRWRALENAVINLLVLFYWVNFEFVLWMSGETWYHHTGRPLYSVTTQSEESFMFWFGTMLSVLQNICFLTLCTPGKAKQFLWFQRAVLLADNLKNRRKKNPFSRIEYFRGLHTKTRWPCLGG